VIAVLFFRFTIDQNIIDLKDTIFQQEEILKTVKPIIDESEIVDFKIKNIKELMKNQDRFKNQIEYILSIFPSSAYLTRFSVSDNEIVMNGDILDPNHLQAFFNRLKKEKKFAEVNLGTITKSEKGFTFALTLNNYKE
jgi:Tfp pilus assembly protein PilN